MKFQITLHKKILQVVTVEQLLHRPEPVRHHHNLLLNVNLLLLHDGDQVLVIFIQRVNMDKRNTEIECQNDGTCLVSSLVADNE